VDHVIPLAYSGSIVPPTLKHRFGPCGAVSAPSGRVELGLQLIPHRVGVWISRMVRGEQGPSFMSAISGQAKRGAGGRSSVASSSRETQYAASTPLSRGANRIRRR